MNLSRRPRAVRSRVAPAGALALVAAVWLAGCAPGDNAPMPTPSATYTSTWTAPPAVAIAPLSGRIVLAGSLEHPSIAAKIDNHPDARPQLGLETTDIVFEELVEGGLTRYVAIWHSTIPVELGPVRSIRPMDPDILSPFGGIVAYSGGQQKFVSLMRKTPVYNAIHGQSDTKDTFYRAPDRDGPHDVLVRATQVVAQHAELPAPGQQFGYSLDAASATATKDGVPTAQVALRFGAASTPSWVWNLEKSAWLRSQAGVADLDSAGTQLSATNVVVLRVPVSFGFLLPKTELIGGGEAWVSTGGATVHAAWSKASATARIVLVDDNGAVIRLAPGNSWVELVPLTGSVTIQ